MAYIHPQMVLSPKAGVSNLQVIYDGGEGQWSAARMNWYSSEVLALRWNGEDGSVGNPQSRGVPTWFVVPDELSDCIEKRIVELKSQTA